MNLMPLFAMALGNSFLPALVKILLAVNGFFALKDILTVLLTGTKSGYQTDHHPASAQHSNQFWMEATAT
jgi:hypothetical protein